MYSSWAFLIVLSVWYFYLRWVFFTSLQVVHWVIKWQNQITKHRSLDVQWFKADIHSHTALKVRRGLIEGRWAWNPSSFRLSCEIPNKHQCIGTVCFWTLNQHFYCMSDFFKFYFIFCLCDKKAKRAFIGLWWHCYAHLSNQVTLFYIIHVKPDYGHLYCKVSLETLCIRMYHLTQCRCVCVCAGVSLRVLLIKSENVHGCDQELFLFSDQEFLCFFCTFCSSKIFNVCCSLKSTTPPPPPPSIKKINKIK